LAIFRIQDDEVSVDGVAVSIEQTEWLSDRLHAPGQRTEVFEPAMSSHDFPEAQAMACSTATPDLAWRFDLEHPGSSEAQPYGRITPSLILQMSP